MICKKPISYELAKEIRSYLKSYDIGEYLDTFGDNDPDGNRAMDYIMANENGFASKWLLNIGSSESLQLNEKILKGGRK